ncbi:MAG: hypothetical protein QF792_03515, partial [Phycisphaerae bacterium]|nr:hypothetical protein [Phycisphaerae bacterium]
MPLKFTRATNLPIGVDLGSATVTLAQLRLVDRKYELVSAAAACLKRSEETTPTDGKSTGVVDLAAGACKIRELLSQNNFKGRCSILSMPAADTFVRHLKIPKALLDDLAASPRQLDQAIRWELFNQVNQVNQVNQAKQTDQQNQETGKNTEGKTVEGRGESPGTYDVHEAIVRHIVVGQEIYEDGQ